MAKNRPDSRSVEAALDRALTEHQLDESFRKMVRDLVWDTDDRWRVCCGSACEPCVEQLWRAVNQVRQILGVET